MRRQFDQQLALLNRELIEMGALCEEGIEMASRALTEGDKELAKQVSGYTFTCYRTGVDGLRLESSDTANGTWTLKQGTQTYEYAVSDFPLRALNLPMFVSSL